jgi:hypothetical protein
MLQRRSAMIQALHMKRSAGVRRIPREHSSKAKGICSTPFLLTAGAMDALAGPRIRSGRSRIATGRYRAQDPAANKTTASGLAADKEIGGHGEANHDDEPSHVLRIHLLRDVGTAVPPCQGAYEHQ